MGHVLCAGAARAARWASFRLTGSLKIETSGCEYLSPGWSREAQGGRRWGGCSGLCPRGQSPSGEARSPHFLSPSGCLACLSLKHTSIPEQAAEEPVPSWCCFLIAGCCLARGRTPAPRAEGLPGPMTPQWWSAPSRVLRTHRHPCRISAGRLHPCRAAELIFAQSRFPARPELAQGKSTVKPGSPAPLSGLILAHLRHRELRPRKYSVRASPPCHPPATWVPRAGMRVPPLSVMGAGATGLVVGASWPRGSFWGQSGSGRLFLAG